MCLCSLLSPLSLGDGELGVPGNGGKLAALFVQPPIMSADLSH